MVAAYRLRWQIELAFKRLKSGLGIDALQARDSQLARFWLAAHLILGLLIDEAVAGAAARAPIAVATAKIPPRHTPGCRPR
ncbi:transposase [Kozakia baliensis]|uniref:transposase n=1 Tax=Kozakia baliensis TaxID=153496 RepID=UPI000AB8FF46